LGSWGIGILGIIVNCSLLPLSLVIVASRGLDCLYTSIIFDNRTMTKLNNLRGKDNGEATQ